MGIKKSFLRAAALFVAVLTAAFFLPLLSGCGSAVRFRVKYYIAYCFSPSGAELPAELCDGVRARGYAGYAVRYEGRYYLAAAVARSSGEARDIAEGLANIGLSGGVLIAERRVFRLETYNAERLAGRYEGVLSALDMVVRDAVSAAGSLSSGNGEHSREVLRAVAGDIGLLLAQNGADCFTTGLLRLNALAADCAFGRMSLCDVRALAAAAADIVLSVRLT